MCSANAAARISETVGVMNDNDSLATTLCVVALFLGAMQGRLATALSRNSAPLTDTSIGSYTPIPILVGWLAVVVWAFKSWPWYWVIAVIVAFAFASGPLVGPRMLGIWMLLRVACAALIIGAACLLWIWY